MTTVLIVAAHPDDAELAMGGTIAKMIASNWKVILIDLTDGEPTPFGSKEIRAREAKDASTILGIEKRICLNMPNRSLQPDLENRELLAEAIRSHQPDMLFAPALPDWHPDHHSANALTESARFTAKYHKTDMSGQPHWTPKMYYYLSPHRLQYPSPSLVVDISECWQKKEMAIKAYQSQLKNRSDNAIGLLEKVEISNKYFGSCINAKYGEPFIVCESISVSDIRFLDKLPLD